MPVQLLGDNLAVEREPGRVQVAKPENHELLVVVEPLGNLTRNSPRNVPVRDEVVNLVLVEQFFEGRKLLLHPHLDLYVLVLPTVPRVLQAALEVEVVAQVVVGHYILELTG